MKNIHYEKIDSTQKEAWREYEKGTKELLITASIQSDGIGKQGRKWYTETDDNIAFSLLLTPNVNVDKLKDLTIRVAEIIKEIFKLYDCYLEIKKPNDLMIKNKKVGGILLQTKLEKEKVKALIIGVGINTSQKEFNKEIKDIATSIINEYNIKIDNSDFIKKFYKMFIKELKERNIL